MVLIFTFSKAPESRARRPGPLAKASAEATYLMLGLQADLIASLQVRRLIHPGAHNQTRPSVQFLRAPSTTAGRTPGPVVLTLKKLKNYHIGTILSFTVPGLRAKILRFYKMETAGLPIQVHMKPSCSLCTPHLHKAP